MFDLVESKGYTENGYKVCQESIAHSWNLKIQVTAGWLIANLQGKYSGQKQKGEQSNLLAYL